MNIKIHRGQNQIGGSIIEVSSDIARVILDIGIELDEDKEIEVPQIEGLFCGNPDCDAVIITRFHQLDQGGDDAFLGQTIGFVLCTHIQITSFCNIFKEEIDFFCVLW